MNDLGIRTDGDIFRDDAEARAGIREACFEARLVRKLVLEHIQIEHEEGVVAGGFEEGVVPLERGETLRGAFAIQGLEELAFRIVALQLSAYDRRKETEKCGGEERVEISSSRGKVKFKTLRTSRKKSSISSGRKKNSKISRSGEEKICISHASAWISRGRERR